MLTLYPAINPYALHHLAVTQQHTLYVEESGNPQGLPVLFIHGGPGSGCDPKHRSFFDPSVYRIILFDQRGCGQSTPYASLEDNTTQALVTDMEAIRQYLSIERWLLFGGSWGSTLALVYAEAYPDRVMHMILRGIFLGRQAELDWFYKPGGASRVFPEAWEKLMGYLPPEEQDDILGHYYRRLTDNNDIHRIGAAKAWSEWEEACASFLPNQAEVEIIGTPCKASSMARIETHYFVNRVFLEPNQILDNIHKIADIPGVIIHGRYDMVCPLDNAYALQKAWPKARLDIIRDTGHSSREPGMIHALVSATDAAGKLYAPQE